MSPFDLPRRVARSRRGTHSCAEPREMPKKCLRSALVKQPLPSAMFAEMESAARLSWSTRKPVSAREAAGQFANVVGESDGLLVDEEFLEGEGHDGPPEMKQESRE